MSAESKLKQCEPNLFIVGSMKCGTTALFGFLTHHEMISGSRPKELHYFTINWDKGSDWYASHFQQDSKARYFLEASPTYFDLATDTKIPLRIRQFSPEARIVILVRDPLTRSISHFHHLRTVNCIPELQELTFSQFVRREWPENLDASVLERNLSYVLNFSFYAKKIANFSEVFGPQNVFLIENEAMNLDGPRVVNGLLNKLGLEPLPNALLHTKSYVGADKSNEDFELNREMFSRLYAEDYSEAQNGVPATRL